MKYGPGKFEGCGNYANVAHCEKRKYVKMLNGSFLACPRCGHAMAKGDHWLCIMCGLIAKRLWNRKEERL